MRALVLGGYGLNCDLETEYAFQCAGARVDRVFWRYRLKLIESQAAT